MSEYKTNNFLEKWQILESELQSQREEDNIFVEYHKEESSSLGCRFSKRKANRYDCSECRHHIYLIKKGSEPSGSSNTLVPAYFYLKKQKIEWKNAEHQENCKLQTFSKELCLSAKKEAVVAKSIYGFSSKQIYDSHLKKLLAENTMLITTEDIEESYKTFLKARSALDKAKCRVNSKDPILVENNKINKDFTVILPTKSLDEEIDYFLIEEHESGVVVLGNKFLIQHLYESSRVSGDGTFKIAPTGYTQIYILWYFEEGLEEGSTVLQYKTIAAAYFIMKSKKKTEYRIAFNILEKYR